MFGLLVKQRGLEQDVCGPTVFAGAEFLVEMAVRIWYKIRRFVWAVFACVLNSRGYNTTLTGILETGTDSTMARNRGKKALYEVMSKAKAKPGHGRTLEQMPAKRSGEDGPAAEQKSTVGTPKGTVRWSKKPRLVQYNAGRIEFAMPYQVAVALVLGLILVILVSYRLGQLSYQPREQEPAQPSGLMRQVEKENGTERAMIDAAPSPPAPVEDTPPETEIVESDVEPNLEPATSTGSNVIVLAQYDAPADLAAVQAYFEKHGIITDIKMIGGRYFLLTTNKYDNPNRPGTDGYKARQRIIEIGAEYKAPPGHETFAKHLFSDAYGMKVD